MDSVEELRRRFSGVVLSNEPMALHTNYRIGGPAELFAVAESADELCQIARLATELQIPWIVIGNGTNVLVSDRGIKGLVIQNRARRYEIRSIPGDSLRRRVYGESGAAIADVARDTIAAGLGGLQYAICIPGSLGGGVVSNAAAHGGSLSQVLRSASVLCDGSTVRELALDELGLGYRTSIFKDRRRPRDVILSVELELAVADRRALEDEASAIRARRAARLPTEPSAGSTFKNPPGHLVADLIEKAGLKGYRIGDAQVSPKHANFLVNLGRARAEDVRALIDVVRERVRQRFGVDLELEIEMIGEW